MSDDEALRGAPVDEEDVVIVVPCYNEAERLDVGAFTRFVDTHAGARFLFVDDGSVDDTARVLGAMARDRPTRFQVLGLRGNRGKAEAVRQGLLEALGEGPAIVGFWDADLATPLDVLPDLVDVMRTRPDVVLVMGSRVKLLGRDVQRSTVRHYIGRIFATVVSSILHLPVYDTQCGAKLFRAGEEVRRTLERPFITRWIFDVEVLARLALGRGGLGDPEVERAIYEVPLPTWRDVAGSRIRLRDFGRAPLDVLRIWWTYGRG